VAPIKKATFSRLELCGSLLVAKLYKKAVAVLNFQFSQVILWTDSTITLSWIQGNSTRWKIVVGNRVATIQELTHNAT
jgi:hypothetical protein